MDYELKNYSDEWNFKNLEIKFCLKIFEFLECFQSRLDNLVKQETWRGKNVY